ncbi:hypothetical protein BS78_03G247500 [Paspalum vaginatum]|nr:hypothetical protein BS78_03G247500 [Paspalum vaginatum]
MSVQVHLDGYIRICTAHMPAICACTLFERRPMNANLFVGPGAGFPGAHVDQSLPGPSHSRS